MDKVVENLFYWSGYSVPTTQYCLIVSAVDAVMQAVSSIITLNHCFAFIDFEIYPFVVLSDLRLYRLSINSETKDRCFNRLSILFITKRNTVYDYQQSF